MVNYESIYPGATYNLDPEYGRFTGYRALAGELGATTSVQTANQLKEVNNLLNQGIKNTEVSIIQMDTFEMIPKEQFKEIQRLNDLTGAESTLHAPIVEPSGFTDQGWSEENRELAERQLTEVVERGHMLNKKGNMPVTIHASSIPGSETMPTKDGEVMQKLIAVDRSSGKFMPLVREEKFYPHTEGAKPKLYEPEEELKNANVSYWDNKLSELLFHKEKADELLAQSWPTAGPIVTGQVREMPQDQTNIKHIANVDNAKIHIDETYQSLMGVFNQAYKYGDEQTQNKLKQISKEFRPQMEEYRKTGNLSKHSDNIQRLIKTMKVVTTPNEKEGHSSPQIYQKAEEFALEKASGTLGNVAANAYKKYGIDAPIVSIENPPYGSALSTGKDLKNLVKETRKKFANNLIKNQGKSEAEAKEAAERLIGVTWDTSHINMIRKQGFGKERIVQETKEVAPFIKHVHLNDNFGSTHTDLPPGMGNIPMKEVLEEINSKAPGTKKIFEGGNFFQHFQTSPHPYVLEGLGSPIYSSGGGPYWNQLGNQGAYFSGQGPINPAIHHSIYDTGFSNLPSELGGQVMQGGSRFSGTPNE